MEPTIALIKTIGLTFHRTLQILLGIETNQDSKNLSSRKNTLELINQSRELESGSDSNGLTGQMPLVRPAPHHRFDQPYGNDQTTSHNKPILSKFIHIFPIFTQMLNLSINNHVSLSRFPLLFSPYKYFSRIMFNIRSIHGILSLSFFFFTHRIS